MPNRPGLIDLEGLPTLRPRRFFPGAIPQFFELKAGLVKQKAGPRFPPPRPNDAGGGQRDHHWLIRSFSCEAD